MPAGARATPGAVWRDDEPRTPEWYAWKATVAAHFAWAVPTEEALAAIARQAPRLVEVGCGSGYWACLLARRGIDVLAYDVAAPAQAWHPICLGDAEVAAFYPDRALFLCWPPFAASVATRALAAYRGEVLIFAGEWRGGSAEPAFFDAVAAGWSMVDGAPLPNWRGRFDQLFIFRRRA